MRRFARSLIADEAKGDESAATMSEAAFHALEELRQPLTTLMGHGGFRALLSRALALATTEVRWLRTVKVSAKGELEGVVTLPARIDPAEFREGRVELLAQLLGLLVAFIGPKLTLHLISEIWPKILLSDLDLTPGGKYEKTK